MAVLKASSSSKGFFLFGFYCYGWFRKNSWVGIGLFWVVWIFMSYVNYDNTCILWVFSLEDLNFMIYINCKTNKVINLKVFVKFIIILKN